MADIFNKNGTQADGEQRRCSKCGKILASDEFFVKGVGRRHQSRNRPSQIPPGRNHQSRIRNVNLCVTWQLDVE